MSMPQFSKKQLYHVWQLLKLFWRGPQKKQAWGLLAIIVPFTCINIYLSVLYNNWHARFYDALQNKDIKLFYVEGYYFLRLLIPSLVLYVIVKYATSVLSFLWRQWLTHFYLDQWLDSEKHYRMRFSSSTLDNPDQRIAQDTYAFSQQVIELSLNFFTEIITFIWFVKILWNLSGSWPINLGPIGHYSVPGYLVWISLLYVTIDTFITFWIGKPIIKLDYQQEQLEADFRYRLVRIREHSEEIAFFKGGRFENTLLRESFSDIRLNYFQLLKQYIYVHGCQELHKNSAIFFPVIMASGNYFANIITLGTLMQIRSAFGHVQRALSVLIYQYGKIAAWIATTKRLTGFSEALLDKECMGTEFSYTEQEFNDIVLRDLSLHTPQNLALKESWSYYFKKGTPTLIQGKSGGGKTTLLRALAGLWPYGVGEIEMPCPHELLFIPQRPYQPLGTLRQSLTYPIEKPEISDPELQQLLHLCELAHLGEYLHEVADWSQRLSLGEQQRISFVRAFVHKPTWLLMDEPTSALDHPTEQKLFHKLQLELPETTYITISHSQDLALFHQAVLKWEALESLLPPTILH